MYPKAIGTAIPDDLADDLAAQFPDEIARSLQPPALVAAGATNPLNRREFVHRIAEACHMGDDQAATNRCMQALMKMKKLDIAKLQAAYEGKG